MKTNHVIKSALLACLVALAAQPAVAGLKINLVNLGGTPPNPTNMVGGGNLPELMEVAAKSWERVFNKGGSKWELTVYYYWTNNLGNLFGQEHLISQGGRDVVRITESRIVFNSRPPLIERPGAIPGYFADPTPKKNSEYTVYESPLAEIEDFDFNPLGEINVGRVFSGATGAAAGRIDLLTIATHEIGHALGLDGDYVGYLQQFTNRVYVLITAPLPFSGFPVHLTLATGDHILFGSDLPPVLPLMIPNPFPGRRQLITGLDALLLGQLSSFDRPDLGEPPGVPKVHEEP